MKQPPQQCALVLSCDDWLRMAMIIFGVMDAQNVCCRRLLAYHDMLTLTKAAGKMSAFMMYSPMPSWRRRRVLLTVGEVDVLLKVIRWYEDTLLAHQRLIEKQFGENELLQRYEALTRLSRAVQTAPTVNSDQFDC